MVYEWGCRSVREGSHHRWDSDKKSSRSFSHHFIDVKHRHNPFAKGGWRYGIFIRPYVFYWREVGIMGILRANGENYKKIRIFAYKFHGRWDFRGNWGKWGESVSLCKNSTQVRKMLSPTFKYNNSLSYVIYCSSSINYVNLEKWFLLRKRKTPTTLTTLTTLEINQWILIK